MAAGFAAERATAEDIAVLNKLVARARNLTATKDPDLREFYRLERKLHLELARISKNILFQWIAGSIALHYWEMVEPPVPAGADEPRTILEDWVEIITAIQNREIMHVQSIIRSHLGRHRAYLRKMDR